MTYIMPAFKRRHYGSITQSAGTAIVRLVEPMKGAVSTITEIQYTAGATAHTLTVLRPLNKTYTTAAAAASQAVINIQFDPGKYSSWGTINTADNLIAANDYVVYELADGTYYVDTVSSVSGLAITMTNNIGTATVLKGAPFWWYGITTDTNPADGNAHPKFTLAASGVTKIGSDAADAIAGNVGSVVTPSLLVGMVSTSNGRWPLGGYNEPLLVYSNNATNAGTLERVTVVGTAYA